MDNKYMIRLQVNKEVMVGCLGDKKIVNLTPHMIRFQQSNREVVEVPSCGEIARVETIPGEEISPGFYTAPLFGEVINLPSREDNVILIVSSLVAGRCIGRDDVFSPGTGPSDQPIRRDGQVWACTRFVRAPQ